MSQVVLARAPNRKIDCKAAAEMRANGATWDKIAQLLGASSGDAVRQAMSRKGVNIAIRTTINRVATERAKQSLKELSEETKTELATTVLDQSRKLNKTRVKSNLRNIKKIGDAALVLANGAKVIHGWGETKSQPLISLSVLGSVRMEELEDCGDQYTPNSVPVIEVKSETPQDPPKP